MGRVVPREGEPSWGTVESRIERVNEAQKAAGKRVKNDMVVAHYTNKDGKLVVGRVVPREGEPSWGNGTRGGDAI